MDLMPAHLVRYPLNLLDLPNPPNLPDLPDLPNLPNPPNPFNLPIPTDFSYNS